MAAPVVPSRVPLRLEGVPLTSPRGVFGLLILALIGLVIFVPAGFEFYLFMQGEGSGGDAVTISPFALWANVVFQVLLFALLPIAYLLLVRPGADVLGLLRMHVDRRTPLMLALGLGVAVAMLLALAAILYALAELNLFKEEPSVLVEELGRVVRAHPEFILILPLSAGITEEILFRGVLQPRIGLVASSILFGLVHVGYGTVVQLVAPLLLGFLFGLLYRWSRSLWLPISAHFCFDFIQFGLLFLFPEGAS